MNSKRPPPPPPPPPSDSDKTVMLGSGRRWTPAPFGTNPSADEGKTTAVDFPPAPNDGKTTFVGDAATGSPDADASGRLRPDPSPRLSWPARDLNRFEHEKQPPAPKAAASGSAQDDDRTRLYNPAAVAAAARAPDAVPPAPRSDAPSVPNDRSADPVVGWLVVVEGPGKGSSIEIGIGANSIGREKGQKLRIDFGDQHISREKHAILIFDPRSSRFFIQSGDVRNLTYIGDELVLSPTELKGGETILVGQTKLRFVAFCGPEFGWS